MSINYSTDSPNNIETALNKLSSNDASLSGIINTLQQRVNKNPATVLSTDMDSLININSQIVQAEKDLQIAKDRSNSLRKTSVTSYYESWFPINRPLRKSSMFVLLIIGIFFFTLTFFIVLQSFGLHLHLNISWYSVENIAKLKKLFPLSAIIIIVGLIILSLVGWLRNI